MMRNKKIIGALLLVIALLFLLGFRVGHPQAGLTNALGSAESGVVIYQKADSFEVGQKVIAKSGDSKVTPFLGRVTAATGDRFEVSNGRFTESLAADDIKGKMVFVIPFLGSVLGWIGL